MILNRRRFLMASAAALPLTGAQLSRGKYGYMDVTMARARGLHPGRVWVDGVEVTDDCVAFDDIEGWALLYKKHVRGHEVQRHLDHEIGPDGALTKYRMYGEIRFRPMTTGERTAANNAYKTPHKT
jgi:hypothetical protein